MRACRFGLTTAPPKIILEYVNPKTQQLRIRSLRLDDLHSAQDPDAVAVIVVDALPKLSNGTREGCLRQVGRLVERLQKSLPEQSPAPEESTADVEGAEAERPVDEEPAGEEAELVDDDALSEVPSVYEEDFELSDVSGISHNNSLSATPVDQGPQRRVNWGNSGSTPVQVLEMSLTPNEIRRERTREPNFHPLDDEDWQDPDDAMVAW